MARFSQRGSAQPNARAALSGLVMAAGALLLAACPEPSAPQPTGRVVAPLPTEYTCEQQRQLANEFAALPEGSMLRRAIVDYDAERRELRSVHKLPRQKACP